MCIYLIHFFEFVGDDGEASHELVQPLFPQIFKSPPTLVSLGGYGVQLCPPGIIQLLLRERERGREGGKGGREGGKKRGREGGREGEREGGREGGERGECERQRERVGIL